MLEETEGCRDCHDEAEQLAEVCRTEAEHRAEQLQYTSLVCQTVHVTCSFETHACAMKAELGP